MNLFLNSRTGGPEKYNFCFQGPLRFIPYEGPFTLSNSYK